MFPPLIVPHGHAGHFWRFDHPPGTRHAPRQPHKTPFRKVQIGLPALQGGTLLKLQDLLHDVLPIPFGHLRIDGHQVGAGDLQVNGRLLVRLVLGVKNSLRRHLVAGLQTGLFAGDAILNKINAVASIGLRAGDASSQIHWPTTSANSYCCGNRVRK